VPEDGGVLVLEVANPGADGFGEHIGAVAGGRAELGDHGCRVGGVPVAGADRVEGDTELHRRGEASTGHGRVSFLRPRD